MYVQLIQRVELNPEIEDEFIDKYSQDDKWKRIYNDIDKVVFESEPLRYITEPKYLPGTLN